MSKKNSIDAKNLSDSRISEYLERAEISVKRVVSNKPMKNNGKKEQGKQ